MSVGTGQVRPARPVRPGPVRPHVDVTVRIVGGPGREQPPDMTHRRADPTRQLNPGDVRVLRQHHRDPLRRRRPCRVPAAGTRPHSPGPLTTPTPTSGHVRIRVRS